MDNTPDLSVEVVQELLVRGHDFLYANGLMMRTPGGNQLVPFTLLPTPMPTSCFNTAMRAQNVFNTLMHRVAHDYEFLKHCLAGVVEVDSFTRDLWNLYERARKMGTAQRYSLAMNRSDYMVTQTISPGPESDIATCSENNPHLENGVHNQNDPNSNMGIHSEEDTDSKRCRIAGEKSLDSEKSVDSSRGPNSRYILKQVEFNTMASGAGSLSQRLNDYHRYILHSMGLHDQVNKIAANRASDGLADAVVRAWKLSDNPKSVVLFLVLDPESNIFDQRLLEYSIHACDPLCRVIRRTLGDIRESAALGQRNELLIDGFEVAVVYQRCCYNPTHFKDEQDWESRLLMERSAAIVCPSLHYHLAGTKKVQQVLCETGVLEKFLSSQEDIDLVRSTQAKQHHLDLTEEGDRNAALGIANPHLYVLKPQREGGGNNVFGSEIAEKLRQQEGSPERAGYILMERLQPPRCHNYLVRPGMDAIKEEVISELGIFGSVVGDSESILHNATHGYLFRTKKVGTDEGGLMTATCCLDSVLLV